MSKNKTDHYDYYMGTLYTYDVNGRIIFGKRIYFRYTLDEEGNEKAKEILTRKEFPTAIGILLGEYSNVDNFVATSRKVFDDEIKKYLKKMLSDENLFDKEITQILSPESLSIYQNDIKKKIKM